MLKLFSNDFICEWVLTMNHRYGSRLTVQLDVNLYRKGKHLGRYLTRDLSPDGAFLETGCLELRMGDLVDLSFTMPGQPSDGLWIKGIVIRRSNEGAGFMLSGDSRQIYSSLKYQLLKMPDDMAVRHGSGGRDLSCKVF